MATFKDLKNDWSMLCQECTDCWSSSDLQLAAELGKTLLERNKELENTIKIHQSTIEEQAQEIEYMKKQTAALREVNDSRLRIYEQLEVSIQDLERANHHLVLENTGDKKLIKSQCLTIENLEARCEELQKRIEELNEKYENLVRQQQSASVQSANTARAQTPAWKGSVTPGGSIQQSAAPPAPKPFQETYVDANVRQPEPTASNDEEVTELLRQLQEARSQRAREQKKVEELGQQLESLLRENNALEEQINVWRSKAEDVKNLQEEINTLEEVRRGQLCGRCLRSREGRAHDEISVMLDQEEYDDISLAESLISDNQHDLDSLIQDTNNKSRVTADDGIMNSYRVLVEKYQALLELQRLSASRGKNIPMACMSLQEELQMSGEFNSFNNPSSETEIQQESTKSATTNGTRNGKSEICGKKSFSATPTDFSEAETSSSGFSDETSNKATQTEGRPGSFLCTIADGEDCKFSIYDDNSPFESRFRNTPEYREIFSEIFSNLKRAAEAQDEGEKLPLLNNSGSTNTSQDQPPAPAQEDIISEVTDDNQSVISSVVSSVVSEPLYRVQSPSVGNQQQNKNEANKANTKNMQNQQNGRCLDYVSVDVHVTKNSYCRRNNRKLMHNDRSGTPDVTPTPNSKYVRPKSNSGGKRRYRPHMGGEQQNCSIYNGRRSNARNNTDQHNNSFEYREFKPSTASAEVARLKRLELSYAEVLRLPTKSKVNNHHRS